MFDIDKWQEIFSTIQKNKLRTLATAFSVFWGILTLVMLLGAGQGLQNGVQRSMQQDATNSIWFFTWRTSIPFKGMPPGRNLQFTEEDLKSIEENIDGIEIISPENGSGNFNVKRGNKNAPFRIFGAEEDFFAITVTQKYIAGRKLNRIDDIQARKICVIGDRVAEVLFEPDEDPIGKYININDLFFKVVGSYRFEGYSINWESERIYIPFTTFQRTFNSNRSVDAFAVTTKEGVRGKDLEKRILKLLAQRHVVHPDDNQAFWTHNQEEEHRSLMNLFLGIKTFLWFVGIGTLIAGIVGISNIMIIVVKERTREIGIRKAVGATPWSIVSLIIQESIMITAVAGYTGLVVGVGLLEGINYLMEMADANIEYFNRPEIDFTTAVCATIVLTIAGAIAGFIPARQASMVNPVEALRNE